MPSWAQNVVLTLDPIHGLFDVRQDRAVQEVRGTAVADDPAEDAGIERVGDRVAFVLGIGQPAERCEKLVARVDDLHRNVHLLEHLDHPLRLAFAHQRVVDEDRPQPIAQRPVPESGDHRTVHATAQCVDRPAVAHRLPNRRDLLLNEGSIVHLLHPFSNWLNVSPSPVADQQHTRYTRRFASGRRGREANNLAGGFWRQDVPVGQVLAAGRPTKDTGTPAFVPRPHGAAGPDHTVGFLRTARLSRSESRPGR